MSKTVQGYVLHDKIGSGQYGNVYRAQHKQKQGLYAVKIMNITKFKETPKLLELVDNQIKILSKLKHPNIIRFYEMFQKPNNYYLVYQFCNGGTLDQLIKSKIKLPQAEAMDIFQQLRAAYSALYEAHILHRDLKPTNILFHNGVVKIADFGFCKEMLKEKDMAQTMVGSPIFMAPEVLKGNFYDARADIWSLGIVLFEMLYGFCPYEQQSIPKLISAMNHHLVTFPAQPIVSQQVKGYILLMLTINYKDRLAPSQFVSTNYKNFKPVESHLNYKEVGKYVRSALIYLTETLDTITQFADDLKFLRVAYMIFKIICSILKHTAMNGNYWQNLSIVNTSEQWQFTLKQEEKIIAPYGVIVKEALAKFDASLKTKVELETAIVDLKYFLECINKIGNAPLKQKMINCFLYNKHFVLTLQKKSPEWIDPTSKILSMEDKQALCKQYARYF